MTFLAYLATQKVAGAYRAVAVTCASGELENKATSWNNVLEEVVRHLIKLPLVRSGLFLGHRANARSMDQ